MWLPICRTGTSGANKEGDVFPLNIQNRKVILRSSGLPGEGVSSLSLAGVHAQLGWPFGRNNAEEAETLKGSACKPSKDFGTCSFSFCSP